MPAFIKRTQRKKSFVSGGIKAPNKSSVFQKFFIGYNHHVLAKYMLPHSLEWKDAIVSLSLQAPQVILFSAIKIILRSR